MKLARVDRDEFFAKPIGHCTVNGRVLVGCPLEDLRVGAVWGRPTPDDAVQLAELVEVIKHPSVAERVDALTDVSAMVGVDPRSFYRLVAELKKRRELFKKRVRRQAFIRIPHGDPGRTLVSAVVAGMYEVVGHSFPVAMFDSYERAARWLRRDLDGLQVLVQSTVADAALTPRERQAVRLAGEGRTNKSIAHEMDISASTVSVLLHRAARKVKAKTREELAYVAKRLEG